MGEIDWNCCGEKLHLNVVELQDSADKDHGVF